MPWRDDVKGYFAGLHPVDVPVCPLERRVPALERPPLAGRTADSWVPASPVFLCFTHRWHVWVQKRPKCE